MCTGVSNMAWSVRTVALNVADMTDAPLSASISSPLDYSEGPPSTSTTAGTGLRMKMRKPGKKPKWDNSSCHRMKEQLLDYKSS